MASIVEKETGQKAERDMIAGVFVNRLRQGMMLQTDPTVIYGLGTSFDGNLRRRDLQADTPFNTYTRVGLPPPPIALPGQLSLPPAVRRASPRPLHPAPRARASRGRPNDRLNRLCTWTTSGRTASSAWPSCSSRRGD